MQGREQFAQRIIGNPTRGANPIDFTRFLHHAQTVHERARGHQLGVSEPVDEAPLLSPRDAVIFQPEPSHIDGRRRKRIPLFRLGETDHDVGVDAGGGELIGRLIAIPAVGDERGAIGPHQHHRRRTREPGEIPDVDEAGHQQRVDAVESGTQPVQPLPDHHRSQAVHASVPAVASTANR